jgi:hypothetical protein
VVKAENSEASSVNSFVAVAVMACPTPTFHFGLKAKEALPLASTETLFWPMNLAPSSVPDGLEKNSMV